MKRSIDIAKFDELDETWVQTGRLWTRCVFIGAPNNPNSPLGVAIKAAPDAGDLVAGKRSFGTTTMTVILSGTVMHDGKWMSQGDIYMAPPNEMNGDLLFGPEGAVMFIMFDCRSGIIPTFADPDDQARFDASMRADVEDVAAGKYEKTVALLPPREHHTKGRAIVFETVEAVAKYRAETGTDW
ncbi:hypothetical protein [Sphingobium subterraneum]|uniref:Uncharacterized protein n=1 Tax=Sphingobium subterraneum TaxID=627688 RepID=A0A841J4E6_9SPHN|nr:hypothetical protein [Sphingobium subterraneum]MBB6123398.1 hypothetical protein [Sphingobium subterraneum]